MAQKSLQWCCLLLILATTHLSISAQYLEQFSVPNKGYLTNNVNDFSGINWTLSAWSAANRDVDDYLQTTASGVLEGIDLDQEVCWISPMLVATSTGTTAFTADLTWNGYDNNQTNPLEFVNVEYQLNGGTWVRHPNVIGADGDAAYTVRYTNATGPSNGSATTNFTAIPVTMGDMMQVRVCWSNNANAELTTLDNVSVTNFVLASACLQPTVVLNAIPTGSCDPNSGTIEVTASNATPGYQVSWSGPSSGNPAGIEIASAGGTYSIPSLAAGNYMVTVMDATGCSRISSAVVTSASLLSLSTQILNNNCAGQAGGEIDLVVSNGVPPYTYDWGHIAGTSDPEDLTGLIAGTYNVTVTDRAGCTSTTSAIIGISSPGPYLETFSIPNKGYLTNQVDDFIGVNWTLSSWDLQPPAANGRDVDDFCRTSGGQLSSIDLDQEVCWTSPLLDIQGITASVSADLTWEGFDDLDYINILYSIDGGSFVQVPNLVGGGTHTVQYATASSSSGSVTAIASGLNGSSLQIRICMYTNANAELITIDNVSVTQSLGYFCPTEINITQDMMDIADGGTFDFGDQTLNVAQHKVFTVSNPSTVDLILSGAGADLVVKGGSNPEDFSIQQPSSSTITAGNSAAFSVSFTPSSLGARSCTLTIPNNDPDENPYDITLNGNGVCPAITFTATPTNTCAGLSSGQIAISNVAGGTGPYMYSLDNGMTFQPQTTFSDLAANSYQIVVKDVNMCLSMPATVIVGSNPLPNCSISGPIAACSGTMGINYEGPVNAASYLWSISGNGVINGANNGSSVTVDAGAAGSYTISLEVADANGCMSNCTLPVIVNASPICEITGNTAVCSGNNGLVYQGPSNMSSYLWEITGSGAIAGADDGQNVSVNVGDAGSFTLILHITDANGCINSCMSEVTVHPLPECLITGPPTTCTGNVGYSYSGPAGMSTYAWSISGDGIISGANSGQSVTVDAGAAGSITLRLTVTDINGCMSSCTTLIMVNAQDDPAFSYASPAFCQSGLDPAPSVSGLTGGTFSSMPAGLVISSTTGAIDLSESSPGTYTVTYTTEGPCPQSSTQSVSIDQSVTSAFAGADQHICGLSTLLAGNSPAVGTGQWTIVSGAGGTITNTASHNSGFTGMAGITYILKWEITNGVCSNFDLVNITLQDTELDLSLISGPPTICPNLNSIPYSVTPLFGIMQYNWSYSGTGVIIHNNGGSSVELDFLENATPGTLSVEAVNTCPGANASQSLNIQLGNVLTCSFINCLVSDILITDNTLAVPGSPQIFKVSDQISSNATLPAPKTFLFKAGDSINLLPGFKVNGGAVFVAQIEDCPVIFPFQSGK